jgi:nicotinamide-nucleotide amidase
MSALGYNLYGYLANFKGFLMNAALIIIGDEILSGRTRDLNGFWLSKFLTKKGIALKKIVVINDSEQEIHATLKDCLNDHDIILTSGGLGPTKDDITKTVLANYFDKELTSTDQSIALIKSLYNKFDRQWTTETNDYHYYPKDFILTDNPMGYAPGLVYHQDSKIIMCAPGVPREFSAMVEEIFLPMIEENFDFKNLKPISLFSVRTKGVAEATIFNELCPDLWDKLNSIAKLSSLPHLLGTDLLLYIENSKYEKSVEEIKNVINDSKLKEHVWQFGNLELEELVVQKCIEKNLTIGFAESCTGGLTSSKITNVSGSSKVFYGSVVSYANDVKMNLLKVKEETLKSFGAVSEQCALEMAIGAKEAMGTDFAVSFTGIAGPGGGSAEKPVGTVGIGISGPQNSISKVYNFRGDRLGLKERFSRAGLFLLLEHIEQL